MLLIDLTAIRANVETLRRAAPQAKFMAVVKDNAYGHGLIEVSRAVVEAGADWLGIVHLTEGVALREAGIELPILMLGYVSGDEVSTALEHQIDVPAMNLEHALELRAAVPNGKRLRVHLKVETGLHRFGVAGAELHELAEFVGVGRNAGPFQPVGIYSHLAAVEEAEMGYTHQQIERFQAAAGRVGGGLIRHLAATAATLLVPESRLDLVRCGIGIYGLWPSEEVRQCLQQNGQRFRPALQWTEPIRAIRSVAVNQPVGYGCSWRPKQPSRIALLDVGYADGLPRALSNRGIVVVNGEPCPVVGRICSNATFVDVTDTLAPKVGGEAVLLAADERSVASIEAQAQRAGTINYELAIRLPEHLTRRYLQ